MFNIINFAEAKTKNGCNLKLSAYVDDKTEAGGHWENIYIYIPYKKKTRYLQKRQRWESVYIRTERTPIRSERGTKTAAEK